MDRWCFNSVLFRSLPKVLGISGTEIARRSGLPQQVLSRYTTNEVVVSVQVLMKICNSLRMPIRYFVSENNYHVMPVREKATVAPDRWLPIGWDALAVEQAFGDGEGRVYWKDVADVMGVTPQKPHERFLLRTRFPVTDFLSTCSRFNLSPFLFLIDGNAVDGQAGGPVPEDGGSGVRKEVAVLRRRVEELSAAVSDLSSKYQALLSAHEALSRRVSVNIENINSAT